MSEPTEWKTASRVSLREYRRTTNDELINRLTEEMPQKFTTEELLTKPSEAIARHGLLIAGWEQAIQKIKDLALDDLPNTDHAN